MTDREIRLELVKAVFPIYKDFMTFSRVADNLYNWIGPDAPNLEKHHQNRISKNYGTNVSNMEFQKINK
jgi:hypothetical protein